MNFYELIMGAIMGSEFIYSEKTYKLIGICMEIHNILGKGYLESVYKDALEYEFKIQKIPYIREKRFKIRYKDIMLNHCYISDFIVCDEIILEIKCCNGIVSGHIKQTLNYLAVSKLKLGLIINFGEDSLKTKRIIL